MWRKGTYVQEACFDLDLCLNIHVTMQRAKNYSWRNAAPGIQSTCTVAANVSHKI